MPTPDRLLAGTPARRFLSTLAVVALTALATVAAPAITPVPAGAASTPAPPYWPHSPFDVPSGVGASVPFTEYEAEGTHATTTGSTIGPDFTQGDLASEASGREAVQLTAQGQYVQFTLTAPANALDVSYALNQGAAGSLAVYVNGTKQSQELSLTSQYSYITTSNIPGSKTHHFFNDVRMLLGQQLNAGDTVRLQVDSDDTAVPYTIDVADFYQAPAAASQPANSISVVSKGADPTGNSDSTSAFQNAISAADAAGQSVWIPPGTFLLGSHLQINSATIAGAGYWYTQLKTNEFIDNTSPVPGPINLRGFAILGNTVGRHDDSTANAIDGSLGTGSTVDGLWIQDTNVGFWLQYGNSDLTVQNSVILSTDADGLNFNGNATNSTVKNNFIRNTGDDGLAIWSYPAADSGITFANNTIVQPNLANGIADYGGSNNTISNDVVADTNALGSGIVISNQQFLSPGFAPLSGTITLSGNYLIRTGALNPNWGHPMSAIRFDAYDYAFSNVTVNMTGGAILDSPYSAMEFVGGGGTGLAVTGVNVSGVTVTNVGTVVMQAETQGSGSFGNVTATGVGVAGIYNCSYPAGTAPFTFNSTGGDSGWSNTLAGCTFPNPASPGALAASPSNLSFGDLAVNSTSPAQTVTVTNPGDQAASVSSITASGDFAQTNTCGGALAAGASCTVSVTFTPTTGGTRTGTLSVASSAPSSPLTVALTGKGIGSTTNLAQGQPVTASSSYQTYVAANAVDGDPNTYWESSDGAGFPQTLTVDLGSAQPIGSVVLDLPPSSAWATRTETLSVLGSTDGSTFTQIVGSQGYTFDPASGNTVTIPLPSGTNTRYVQLSITGNTGWNAAQISEFEVFPGSGSGGGGNPGSTNLALHQPATASGYTQNYLPANAVDGDANTYWESTDNAFPQWLQVDLGSATSIGRMVLDLPPSAAWGARTQTITIQGSTDGANWSPLVPSQGYTFDPATGNTTSVTFGQASVRYVKLTFTANTGWPAGQLSELQVYNS